MAYHLGCMAANSSKTLAKRNNGKHRYTKTFAPQKTTNEIL